MPTLTNFLIAHTNNVGTNVAQKSIPAESESQAKAIFARFYPERVIQTVGIEGAEDES